MTERYHVILEGEPRPHLARFLKRVLREEKLACVEVREITADAPERTDAPATGIVARDVRRGSPVTAYGTRRGAWSPRSFTHAKSACGGGIGT